MSTLLARPPRPAHLSPRTARLLPAPAALRGSVPAVAGLACIATLLVLLAGESQAAPSSAAATAAATAAPTKAVAPAAAAKLVERGRYLVNGAGCHDCHTPMKMGPQGPEPDMSRALSGHPEGLVVTPVPKLPEGPWVMTALATNTAFAGPWGVSFPANLTPDAETGLGQWSQRNFIDTIKTGRHMGRGRPILPPMPIPAYRNLTESDLAAIYAYLRTVPAVKNRVPDPLPPAAQATAPAAADATAPVTAATK